MRHFYARIMGAQARHRLLSEVVVSRRTRKQLRRFATAGALTVTFGLTMLGCERKPCARDCEWAGLCTPIGYSPSKCHAASDADCHRAKACRFYGKCTAMKGACVRRSAADCKRSNKCRWAGECGFKDGKCTAIAAKDCQRSKYCKEKGMCTLKRKYGGLASCIK